MTFPVLGKTSARKKMAFPSWGKLEIKKRDPSRTGESLKSKKETFPEQGKA
jgi:hypothetical protein